MSDYRPVMRAASGEGKHVWLLLHGASGEMAGGRGAGLLIYTNKGEATRAGEVLTAQRLNPEGLTTREAAKRARRQAEAVERGRAFEPHQAVAEAVQVKPKPKREAAAGKGKGTRAKRTSARSKGGGMSPPRG